MNDTPRADALLLIARIQAVRNILKLLTKGGSDKEIGRRALLLLWILDRRLVGTQKQLAERLGVSRPRATQMIGAFTKQFGRFPL